MSGPIRPPCKYAPELLKGDFVSEHINMTETIEPSARQSEVTLTRKYYFLITVLKIKHKFECTVHRILIPQYTVCLKSLMNPIRKQTKQNIQTSFLYCPLK